MKREKDEEGSGEMKRERKGEGTREGGGRDNIIEEQTCVSILVNTQSSLITRWCVERY